jgi:hypothetical protein
MNIKKIVITITTAAGLGAGIEYGVTPENLDPLYTYKPVAKTQKVLVAGVDLSRDDRLRASTKLEIFTFLKQYTHFTENSEVNSYDIRTGKYKSEWQGQYIESTPIGVNEKFNVEITEYEIKYIGLWDSTDVVVRTVPNGLKETIVLKDKSAPVTFEWSIKSNVTDVERIIKPPTAYDAVGKIVPVDGRYINGRYYIDIDCTSVVYPIIIDPTVEWQHGSAFGKDNYIDSSNPITNSGTSQYISVYNYYNTEKHYRSLIEFDSLSVIPVGSIVDSAFLDLTLQSAVADSDSTASWHRLTTAWTETVSCWDSASAGVLWSTAGGDYNVTKYGTRKTWGTIGTVIRFTLTTLVQGWVSETWTNYGMLLKFDNENDPGYNMYRQFYSSDNATSTNRPKLIVYYTPPMYKPYNTSASATSTRSFSISATDTTVTRTKLYLITGGVKVDSVTNAGPALYTWNVSYYNAVYTPGTTYTYFVSVTNGTDTAMSAAFSGTTLVLTAPYSVSISSITDSSLTVSATDSNKSRKGLYLYRKGGAKLDSMLAPGSTQLYTWTVIHSSYTPNVADSFYVAVYDSVTPPDTVRQISSLKKYTAAAVPIIELTDTSSVSLTITVGSDDNPSTVRYAVKDTVAGKYLTSSGTLTTPLTWFARSYLVTGITRSSLNPNYAYGMIPYALNSDSVATSAGDSLLIWTWAVVPGKPTVTKYDSVHIRIKVDPLTNPGYTYFALQDSITGKYYDLTNLTFRSTSITTDSSWAWYTYSQWGGASGKLLTVAKGTRYILRMYSKEGRE